MGSQEFIVEKIGLFKNAKEAFRQAVEEAQYDYGHAGYTGSIAEKDDFRRVTLPEGKDPFDYVNELICSEDGFWNDKWGPAACLEIPYEYIEKMYEKEDVSNYKGYLFFGWASS